MGMLIHHHKGKGEVKKTSPAPEKKEVVNETPEREFVAKKRKRDN